MVGWPALRLVAFYRPRPRSRPRNAGKEIEDENENEEEDDFAFFILASRRRILDSEPMRLFQKYRRGEFYEPPTHRMPLKMGARVTRPSDEKLF
jgi:hypothetical protein